jgi:hypothetical protein
MTQKALRTILTLCVVAFGTYTTTGQTASSIIGQWKDEKETDRQMEFFLDKDGLYYSKAINNKSKESINGHVLVRKLQFDKTTKTFEGIMSPPDSDMDMNATISFIHKDKLKVVVKKFLMTKTMYLTRIK